MPTKRKPVKRLRKRAVWPRPEAGDYIRLGGEQYSVNCASDGVPYIVRNGVEYQLRLIDLNWVYDKNRMSYRVRANRHEARRLEKKVQYLGRRSRERKGTRDLIKHWKERP